ncbi:DUF1289 domain-containing protein [Paraburkholderia fungorum]|uniref:DUF1289 domain-containing protein n=1 Tax=Paraburkholderia fungorum TaxID=134537 RepID=UPI0038B92C3F
MSDLESAASGAKQDPVSLDTSDKKQGQSGGPNAPLATVPSPCIDVCKIDGDTGMCIGCLRTRDEIRGWKNMTDELRLEMIEELSHRKLNLETRKAGTL